MLLNFKSAFLLGLVTLSVASPTFDLEARKKTTIPVDGVVCARSDGTVSKTWTQAQIRASRAQADALKNDGLTYPKKFSNKDARGNAIFNSKGQLYEFPLLDPVWTVGTAPGPSRVIVKSDYSYAGVTTKNAGVGDLVHKCENAPAPEAPEAEPAAEAAT
ncbi:hypothetical protein G7Y89_g526 [Cudoniella acicularis]|uniref:Uncharacterized protein n=1 Tax=Cudoniella acicularis TaxID=354080 RepID=A0A8H4RXW0_9HELO|nr:hypothetical protein G7Y89_g526 [Cudoniella acicularis]